MPPGGVSIPAVIFPPVGTAPPPEGDTRDERPLRVPRNTIEYNSSRYTDGQPQPWRSVPAPGPVRSERCRTAATQREGRPEVTMDRPAPPQAAQSNRQEM